MRVTVASQGLPLVEGSRARSRSSAPGSIVFTAPCSSSVYSPSATLVMPISLQGPTLYSVNFQTQVVTSPSNAGGGVAGNWSGAEIACPGQSSKVCGGWPGVGLLWNCSPVGRVIAAPSSDPG